MSDDKDLFNALVFQFINQNQLCFEGNMRVFLMIIITFGCIAGKKMGRTGKSYFKGVDTEPKLSRDIRAASADPRENCSTWSPWVDENKPTPSHKTDYEALSPQALADFCPATYGGTIDKIECNDEKGESFDKNKTSGNDNEFFIGCYDAHVGVTCTITKHTTDVCPDLKIRYYCTCSSQVPLTFQTTTGVTTTTISRTSTTKDLTEDAGIKRLSENVKTIDLDGITITWWVFILMVCLLLFLINVLITVCLYKRAVNKRIQKSIKIHPLRKV